MAVKIFEPAIDNERTCIIRDAIAVAQRNTKVPIWAFPIDTRTEDAIAQSNVTDEIVGELLRSGYSNDAVQVFMLDKDIKAKGLKWCFGATHGSMILISDYRIWNTNYKREVKVAMLSYLIEHEIGHAFHAADDLRAPGIYDLHCTDLCCVMQQVPSLKELADKAKFVTEHYHATDEDECFCPHCRRRLAYFVTH